EAIGRVASAAAAAYESAAGARASNSSSYESTRSVVVSATRAMEWIRRVSAAATAAWEALFNPVIVIRPATPPTIATCRSVASLAACRSTASQAATRSTKSIATLLDADGEPIMATEWEFTQGETGPLTAVITSAEDGAPEDLAAATSVKFNLRRKNGGIVVKRADVAARGADGSFTYNRQAADVAKSGELVAQLEVTRADGTKAFLPTGGIPVIIRPPVVAISE
ncbi:MAG TPA: BppU family phage baseplate upper protein, partial [Gemmatimonadaceae bacterium]